MDASCIRVGPQEAWSIALIDEHEFTCGCIATCLEFLCREIKVHTFAKAADFLLVEPGRFSLVINHVYANSDSARLGSAAFTALLSEEQPTPVMVISDVDDPESIVQMMSAGVRGFVPTLSTNLRVIVEIMRLVSVGGVFAPVTPSMLQQAQVRSAASADVAADRFTPRQLTVLEQLKQGNANKVIAHKLSMSEGTVKVHVRNIMKKTRATNRTQAVFRAYNASSGASSVDGRSDAAG